MVKASDFVSNSDDERTESDFWNADAIEIYEGFNSTTSWSRFRRSLEGKSYSSHEPTPVAPRLGLLGREEGLEGEREVDFVFLGILER